MSSHPGSLESKALDTLALRIAILDRSGSIVETNRAWEEYANEHGVNDPEMYGVDYLAASDVHDERTGRNPRDGIESVLDGRSDLFTYEYPCETPEETQWFLMRVAAFDLDGDRFASVAHLDITERKRYETALEQLVERSDQLLSRGLSMVTSTGSVSEVLESLPAVAVTAGPYVAAWTGRRYPVRAELEHVSTAGAIADTVHYPTSLNESSGLDTPVVRAYTDLETVVETAGPFSVPRQSLPDTVEAEIAIPIHHQDTRFGVFCVYTTESAQIPGTDASVLEVLARLVGQAIHLRDQRQMLLSSTEVRLEFDGETIDTPVAQLAASADTTIELLETMISEGTPELLARSPAPVDVLASAADDIDAIDSLEGYEASGYSIVEIVSGQSLATHATAVSGKLRALRARPDGIEFAIGVPSRRNARTAYEALVESFDGLTLTATTESDGERSDDRDPFARLEADLTRRQHTALTHAYHSGYLDQPRSVDGATLAEAMGITRQTFHQHLRAGQRKVLEAFFTDRRAGE